MQRSTFFITVFVALVVGFSMHSGSRLPAEAQTSTDAISPTAEASPMAGGMGEMASDSDVARMLTDMMGGSPALVVPSLADAPDAMLAKVYVFTNGVAGEGPFGFQPDVFDRPPGDPGYSPLRSVNLVAWTDQQDPRVLTSSEEVMAAEARGELRLERPGIVVNMPFLTWPGGHR